MNTLKNAALLVVMGGVLYFVYVTLQKAPSPAPANMGAQLEWAAPPAIEMGPPPVVTATPAAPAANSNNAMFTQAPSATLLPPPPQSMLPAPPPTPTPTPPPAVEMPAMELPPAPQVAANPSPPATNSAPSAYEVATANNPNPPAAHAPAPESAVQNVSNNEPAKDTGRSLAAFAFQRDFRGAETLIAGGRYRDALALLTPYYRNPDIAPSDRAVLVRWLDALAGKVIFSTEHLLAEPHVARANDTLITLAGQHRVPWQLLQNINGVRDPQVLLPGTVLKIVPGPFRAEVDLTNSETTLYLNDLYAGRFACAFGDEPPAPGEYQVADKSRERPYFSRDNRTIAANDPSNPFGGWWIHLGGNVCLHGSPTSGRSNGLGCVSFSPQDARDLFGILSIGSGVSVKR